MPINTIPVEGLDNDVNQDEFSYTIPDPQTATYPITIAARRAFTIDRVYYTVTSSDGTGVANIDITKNSVDLVDFDNLSVNNTRQYADDAGNAENDIAYEDLLEVVVNSTGGTNREFLTLTFHITYL